jgi:PPP family 3-phenylpropionic acid transporter
VSPGLYWRLAGFYFFYFAYLGAFAPYFSLYLDSLGFSAAAIAVLLSLPQVMRIFAPHLWGFLADRSAQRVRVACLAGLAGTVCYFGVFVSSEWWWLFACIALWSFFWSAALPLMEATTLDHLDKRGADYGRIRLWGSIGFIAAVIGVGWVLDQRGLDSLLPIIGLALLGILLSSWPVPEARHDPQAANDVSIGKVLRRPEVIALIGACFLMAVAHGPYYTFFSIHLAAHDYSKSAIGAMWAVGVIAEIGIFACMPALNRRFSAGALLVGSFAVAIVRFVLIGWFAHWLAVLFLAQLMHAATFGAFHAAALSCVHKLFRGRNQARGQAVYSSLSFGLGGTLGGLGSGIAWERLGPSGAFGAASVCALIGLIVLLAVRSRLVRLEHARTLA